VLCVVATDCGLVYSTNNFSEPSRVIGLGCVSCVFGRRLNFELNDCFLDIFAIVSRRGLKVRSKAVSFLVVEREREGECLLTKYDNRKITHQLLQWQADTGGISP